MPYYVYRVRPFAQLDRLDEFPTFPLASAAAKGLRASQTPDAPGKIKVIFAANEFEAEDLLSQVREPGPSGDD